MLVVAATAFSATAAHATPAEPHGAHPRMILDSELRAAWAAEAKANRGPVKAAIGLCTDARDTAEHDRAVYQGSEWSKVLQGCLVAWAATNDASFAKTAIRFFTALLDDLDRIGDGLGGDNAARRDDGYALRNLGPYTALAYDWLHELMPVPLREHAVQRWAAWLDWYAEKGYRARVPGTNYQAGYLLAATAIAVAQAGEAGETGGTRWTLVADELWGKDMHAALAPGGILDGGDWPEGWQYGPLAVASYSLAARIAARAGIDVQGIGPWLDSLLKRHVYALSPGDGVYAGGDTEAETPTLVPNVLTLTAVALGEATPASRQWAKSELSRLRVVDVDSLLFSALATVGPPPVAVPRASWPTAYLAPATGTLYARTRWDASAMWLVAECQHTIDVDHRHPNAGNFVLSRGPDDVIVDPTPYGSRSTLTSNAPTVASPGLPPEYAPSQGYWSAATAWAWAVQTRTGIVAARCDYRDSFRFQEQASDVAAAQRDLVLLPAADGTAGSLVVIDRAETGTAGRAMYLRFRAPKPLALAGATATATIGSTALAIAELGPGTARGAAPTLATPTLKDCFKDEAHKGSCDAARFAVSDYRVVIPGPSPRGVHVISATAAGSPTTAAVTITGAGYAGVRITAPRDAVVIWPTAAASTPTALGYRAPRGAAVAHVILDAPELAGMATITATVEGDACAVTVAPGGTTPARPVVVTLDSRCAVTADPMTQTASSAAGTAASRVGGGPGTQRRGGCCGAAGGGRSGSPVAALVLVVILRRLRPRS